MYPDPWLPGPAPCARCDDAHPTDELADAVRRVANDTSRGEKCAGSPVVASAVFNTVAPLAQQCAQHAGMGIPESRRFMHLTYALVVAELNAPCRPSTADRTRARVALRRCYDQREAPEGVVSGGPQYMLQTSSGTLPYTVSPRRNNVSSRTHSMSATTTGWDVAIVVVGVAVSAVLAVLAGVASGARGVAQVLKSPAMWATGLGVLALVNFIFFASSQWPYNQDPGDERASRNAGMAFGFTTVAMLIGAVIASGYVIKRAASPF